MVCSYSILIQSTAIYVLVQCKATKLPRYYYTIHILTNMAFQHKTLASQLVAAQYTRYISSSTYGWPTYHALHNMSCSEISQI